MNLYSTLKEIYFSLDNGDRRLLEGFDLSVPRFFLLKHISENPGISLTKLSTKMLTDKSNITRLIKGTEKKGLVQKIRNKSDGRALSLYLTTRGEALLSDAAIAHKKFNENRFSMVHDDIDGLLSELKDVKNRLDKHLSS